MHHILDVEQIVNPVDFEEDLLCFYCTHIHILVIPVAQTVKASWLLILILIQRNIRYMLYGTTYVKIHLIFLVYMQFQ